MGAPLFVSRDSGSGDWRAPGVRSLRGSVFGFLDHMKGMQSACDVCGGFWGYFLIFIGFRGIVDENLAIILSSYTGCSFPSNSKLASKLSSFRYFKLNLRCLFMFCYMNFF